MKKITGGKRIGSGAKLKYGEDTISVATRVPLSKVAEFREFVNLKLKEWVVDQAPVKPFINIPIRPRNEGYIPASLFDFGDDKYLNIEKYTKYPLKDKPANKFDAASWLKEKAAADAKIKELWALSRQPGFCSE